MMPIIAVENLSTYFQTNRGTIKAVDRVSFSLPQGDTLGIVGESWCGKSVLALSLMRLVPKPAGRIVEGKIVFEGIDLLRLSEPEMRRIRGKEVSMIFQEPMTALNPVIRIGDQISEVIRLHLRLSERDAVHLAVEMLGRVGIPRPANRIRNYPHQLSGGMRQRVMIAMALACNPKLLLADEPTTALDVTIQAQILELINDLKREFSASVIIITHDLGVIAKSAQYVGVMYAGKLVEYCRAEELFERPVHPYAAGLLESIPGRAGAGRRLKVIPGAVPNLYELPKGCSFQERCPAVSDQCRQHSPELRELGHDHLVRCWNR